MELRFINSKSFKFGIYGNLLNILLLFFSDNQIFAQSEIQIGINGLTCSLCCKTVEESIRRLHFVEDVKMDLINTVATVRITDSVSDLDKLVKAVVNAGFSVRMVRGNLMGRNWKMLDEIQISLGSLTFKVLNSEAYKPATQMHIQYISKKYLPSKDWKSISRTYPDIKMQTSGHYILIL
ncbi:MAG: heavy-metal-associated domain-containing protein [Saprospiraceae bacterium]|nr:heavy-metal-associated domain-containing protein [Candidatus Vicinibacter affinis]